MKMKLKVQLNLSVRSFVRSNDAVVTDVGIQPARWRRRRGRVVVGLDVVVVTDRVRDASRESRDDGCEEDV